MRKIFIYSKLNDLLTFIFKFLLYKGVIMSTQNRKGGALSPLKAIRQALGLTQVSLSKILGIKQQTLSRKERLSVVPPEYINKLLKKFPKREQEIREAINESKIKPPETIISDELLAALQNTTPYIDPSIDGIEPEALPWALDFRVNELLKRMKSIAKNSGLTYETINYKESENSNHLPQSILFQSSNNKNTNDANWALYPHSLNLKLNPSPFIKKGTMLILGSPLRSPAVSLLLKQTSKQIKIPIEFNGSDRKRLFYFGYKTFLNNLKVKNETFHPFRQLTDDNEVLYEDYGVIINTNLTDAERKLFHERAESFLYVAGAHRLATGIGMRIIENPGLIDLKSHSPNNTNLIVFKVGVKSGEFPIITEIKKIKEYSFNKSK